MQKSIKQQFIDLQEGKMTQHNFMRSLRMSVPQYITNVTSFTDSVRILKNKGILSEADGKDKAISHLPKSSKEQYTQIEKEAPANRQEITTGIHIEHECYPDKTYEEVTKIVLKNLKKNPNYYTNFKLTGIRDFVIQTMDKTNTPETMAMKSVGKDNVVDKHRGMKPVKDVAKIKASANKAHKELHKGTPVKSMTLIAKTVRGLDRMTPTGEKSKKVNVRESIDIETKFDIVPINGAVIKGVKFFPNGEWYQDTKTGRRLGGKVPEHAKVLKSGVQNETQDKEFKPGVNLSALTTSDQATRAKKMHDDAEKKRREKNSNLFKDKLKELIRKEIFDGRDNMTDVTG